MQKNLNYYLNNNLHPIWHLVSYEGNYVLDEDGNRSVQYHIPKELSCLAMYKKLLMLCKLCPTYSPKNCSFGLKGHCVTFPRDISEMCDEIPQLNDLWLL